MEKAQTWTITAQITVFAGDMDKDEVIRTAEEGLQNLIDGSDFSGATITDAQRDEI